VKLDIIAFVEAVHRFACCSTSQPESDTSANTDFGLSELEEAILVHAREEFAKSAPV
jgi:hypothetical protein